MNARVEEADYVIVGVGSAGAVLANRLSEDPDIKVLAIEAGGANASMLVNMPAGVGNLIRTPNVSNWGFETVPQRALNQRRLWQPRGRGLGGSSAINGMIYIRGHARDYDQWRQLGLTGWSYRDVLPYFRKSERLDGGDARYHGDNGPLRVSWGSADHPIFQAFLAAGAAAGHGRTEDFNGAQLEGFGRYQLTIHGGVRMSLARTYLQPILGLRPNLSVRTEGRVTKILIENGRAIGVEAAERGQAPKRVMARREVLLCAGAFQSPQILMLSGVGDPDALARLGLPVVCASPDVGANLQDHLDAVVVHEATQKITGYSTQAGLKKLTVALEWLWRKTGPGAQQFLEAGAFLRSRDGLDRPDLQYHLVNAIMIDHGRQEIERDGFTAHVCQLRPESRGTVTLDSSDAFAAPLIDPNYLATEEDRRALRQGVKMAREVFAQRPFDPFRGKELAPGASAQSDADIDRYIRETAETIYHPVGTCRMGVDPRAVLDEHCRVRGVEGLRVVDASVMPLLVSGNTNAPTVMIAEKIADHIRNRPFLPPEDAPVADAA